MTESPLQPLRDFPHYPVVEMKTRASTFYAEMKRRRTVRDFSDRPIDRGIVEDCLRTAACAPSGANQQRWRFVIVTDVTVKHQIRKAAEQVEEDFYHKEATEKWRETIKPLGAGPGKSFLETAPYLIAVFSQRYSFSATGEKITLYYVPESVGIAAGMLITALHHAGLATLTYTPMNMAFLNEILSRPTNEKPFMILVTGYPSVDAMVPVIQKKTLKEISVFI